jgi:hypothetical protein
VRKRVWFHRCSAAVWLCLLPVALKWWPDSVAFVIIASVYANVKADWAASEAADDRTVVDRLDRIEALLREEAP